MYSGHDPDCLINKQNKEMELYETSEGDEEST